MTRGESTRGIEDDENERQEAERQRRGERESARVTMYAGGLLQGERGGGRVRTEREAERERKREGAGLERGDNGGRTAL